MACTDSTGLALFYLFVGYLLGVVPYWVRAWSTRSPRRKARPASIGYTIGQKFEFRACLCSRPVMSGDGFCLECGGVRT